MKLASVRPTFNSSPLWLALKSERREQGAAAQLHNLLSYYVFKFLLKLVRWHRSICPSLKYDERWGSLLISFHSHCCCTLRQSYPKLCIVYAYSGQNSYGITEDDVLLLEVMSRILTQINLQGFGVFFLVFLDSLDQSIFKGLIFFNSAQKLLQYLRN